jgi:hypothetical protein
MWFWIVGGVSLWILGMIVFYILDGWFDYGIKEDEMSFGVFCAATWPIWIWFVIPGILAGKAHDALKAKKKKIKEKEAKLAKIRIAQEKEIEKIEAELEQSFSQESEKISQSQ